MDKFIKAFKAVREKEPLVQCITNFVTVNDCANVILAAGGSPTMAKDIREVAEAVRGVQALVCNLGDIAFVDSMILGGKEANRLEKPVILDPVAAGGTELRREASKKLMEEVHFTTIRGNASEIRFLAGQKVTGCGVDVSKGDVITDENFYSMAELAKSLATRTGSIIAVSGEIDIITDGSQTVILRNGCSTMARVTGSGCMLTSLIGAYCGAMPEDTFSATVAAMAVMGVCGELAEEQRINKGTGNATFRIDLIDGIFNLTEKQLMEGIRYEIF